MPVPNLLSSVVNKPIIFNTSQLKAEISIVAAPPGSLFSGHKYLLGIIQTSRPTDSPGSGKTITIVEAIMQLKKDSWRIDELFRMYVLSRDEKQVLNLLKEFLS